MPALALPHGHFYNMKSNLEAAKNKMIIIVTQWEVAKIACYKTKAV